MHPDNKTYVETVLIIKSGIRYYEVSKYQREFLQIISVVEDRNSCITISAVFTIQVYIKGKHYIIFFKTLGNCFIAAGDYNIKHTHWGSKLILPEA